jgi:hypothetical protein
MTNYICQKSFLQLIGNVISQWGLWNIYGTYAATYSTGSSKVSSHLGKSLMIERQYFVAERETGDGCTKNGVVKATEQ